MRPASITLTDVMYAYRTLQRLNENAGVVNIRKFLGRGSYTTVSRLLKVILANDCDHPDLDSSVSDDLLAKLLNHSRKKGFLVSAELRDVTSGLSDLFAQVNSIFAEAEIVLSTAQEQAQENILKIELLTVEVNALKSEVGKLKFTLSQSEIKGYDPSN